MPKIIENPEKRLMEEVGRQVRERGYAAMTIRSVAKACGVGVGTVYNYYPSKDALLAAYLLSDWKACVTAINALSARSQSPEPVVQCICDQLIGFARRHQNIFGDEAAATAFAGSFSRYHALLRSQLAAPLQKFCGSEFSAEFIAEALLTWSMAGKTFEEIYAVIQNIF